MRHKKVNKIKRMTQVIKDMTLLLKSFKGMIEVIFYIFLMCYVGYDKISVYSRVKVIEKIDGGSISGINMLSNKQIDSYKEVVLKVGFDPSNRSNKIIPNAVQSRGITSAAKLSPIPKFWIIW